MHLSLFGYGKMGRAVARIAAERGHTTAVLDRNAAATSEPGKTDCVIDFSHADTAPGLIRRCIDAQIPVVSGTTGWDSQYAEIADYCRETHGTLLWAPNFSPGMQIVYQLNRMLARLMNNREEYEVSILEVHHTAKKDRPSGTAIALANQILDELDRKDSWALQDGQSDPRPDTIAVTAERREDVRGIHRVTYIGPYDIVSLRHHALSRDAFALGAVLAAEWIRGRIGVYRFSDVMGL